MLFPKIATANIAFGSNSSGCDGTFDNVHHTINSPNYPSNYGNNELCHWRIQASPGARIQLQFETFVTERRDYIFMYDGSTESSSLLGKLSGNFGSLLSPIFSTGSQLYVIWDTDASITRSGFKIKVIAFRKYNHIKLGAYQNDGNFQNI